MKPTMPPQLSAISPLPAQAGSDFTYTLTYQTLQEIHKLTGMVCGWHMNLPTVMIKQAKKVSEAMLALKRIRPERDCCETCNEFEWADCEIPMCRLRCLPVSPNAVCQLHEPNL